MWIDTHTHLYVEEFADDYPEVIETAIANGVTQMLLPAIDASYHQRMQKIKQEYPTNIFLMAGLHPTYVKPNTMYQELKAVETALQTFQPVAVGEIGIDLYWDKTLFEEQKKAFIQQIHWANDLKLPIAIHSRESFEEIDAILQQENLPNLKGVFHCFTGSLDQAKRAIDKNMLLGIGGVCTYKNSTLPNVLKELLPRYLILETDAPYLPPVPYRGKRNQSSYVPLIGKKLSEIYEIDVAEISKITTHNAQQLFGLK